MKIGIWLDADYRPEEGGGFSYYDKLIKAIDAYKFDDALEICFVSDGEITHLPLLRDKYQLHYKVKVSFAEKIKAHIPLYKDYYKPILQQHILQLKNESYIQQLKSHGVDLIYYLRQGECHVPGLPFVATNWDIGHCSTYAFSELMDNGQYASRSRFYQQILPQALFVFAESESGKKELIRYTNISDDKIKVVPIFAGNCIEEKVSIDSQKDILAQYGLEPNQYFFYPAQFWAHKNHRNLILAFKQLLTSHPGFKLVLTGSDKGNFSYIQELVTRLNLQDNVIFAGFVDNAVINTLYANATALCMASFFGPTNMPPIEAMQIGCPVICSDVSGHHEILGDAALYFNATSVDEITACMNKMIVSRGDYVLKLHKQSTKSLFTVQEALKRINKYMLELIPIRATWK